MARYDVYPTPLLDERRHTPYWLDVQADTLQALGTRVIVPLRRVEARAVLKERLNPELTIDGTALFADTANIAAFPVALLRRPITNLRHERVNIDNALDFLFSGY